MALAPAKTGRYFGFANAIVALKNGLTVNRFDWA
jgi:hypothetical protein